MGTAGGEPRVLLNALKPMLGVVGDIKTPQEVLRVVGMMKDAEKLMSRCIYLNILKATCRQAVTNEEKKETLHKFLATGGWGILNKWLMEFTKSENFPVLLELIDVLKVLPITVDLLKQGNTGKIMKSMTKLEHVDVKKSAAGLIKQWKNMIRVRDSKNKATNEEEEGQKTDLTEGVKGESDEKVKRKLSTDPTKASDSSGFMQACFSVNPSPIKKKRRVSNDTNTKKAMLPLDELLKDTPVEKTEEKETEKTEELGSPEKTDEEAPMLIYQSPAVEAANAALSKNNDDSIIIDEGSLARKKNKLKRNVTWASDEKLVQVSYFELLPGEKKGSHSENFSQARQLELMCEKHAMRAARRGEDRMVEKVEWRILIPVDNAGVPGFIAGEKSKQKFIQTEREKSVLAYIYLSRQSLPDSAAEPDFNPDEHNRSHQAIIIPHDEAQTVLPPVKGTSQKSSQQSTLNTTTSAVLSTSVSQTPQVLPAQNVGAAPLSLSPAVQNIMSHLLQLNNNSNNNSNTTSPTVPPPNALPHMAPQPPLVVGLPGSAPPFPLFPNIPPPNIPPPNIPPPNIPPPNIPPPNMNQQVGNNINNTFNLPPPTDVVRPLMDAPTSNIRGGGPRFGIGRGFNNSAPRDGGGGDGGFSAPGVGPGPRGRWNGPPPNQGPPPDQWNHDNNNNFNDNGNFRGRGRGGQNNFGPHRGSGEQRGGGGHGFRHGGENFHRGRGRGFNDRGRGHSDRGRGSSDRGRGGYHDRGRGDNRNYDDNRNNHRNRKDGEWNRDSRSNYDSNRNRDNSRSRDDRSKGNRR